MIPIPHDLNVYVSGIITGIPLTLLALLALSKEETRRAAAEVKNRRFASIEHLTAKHGFDLEIRGVTTMNELAADCMVTAAVNLRVEDPPPTAQKILVGKYTVRTVLSATFTKWEEEGLKERFV